MQADDKIIADGDELPALTITYDGFIGEENKDNAALKKAASVECKADWKTAGNHDITFSTKAELNDTVGKNYKLAHKNGILTVKGDKVAEQSQNGSTQSQPKTGDESNYSLWILSLLGCAAVILTTVVRRLKRR